MEAARLAKDGTLLRDGRPVAEALPLLGAALELEEGCTLRSFFALLRRYPALQGLSEFLPQALAEAEACPDSGCRSEEFRCLVLGKSMELIGFPGPVRAETYTWLQGLGLSELTLGSAATEPGAAGAESAGLMEADKEIRFVPLARLLDAPLKLGGLKHVVLGDVDRKLFCETRFTLFEVVDGLAWELGFRGGPTESR